MSWYPPRDPKRLAVLLVLVAGAGFGAYELTPSQRLKSRQRALIEWARDGSPEDFGRSFAAPDYSDQWNQDAAGVAQAVRAARFAAPSLSIKEEPPETTLTGREAEVTQIITATADDGETRRGTFHFKWERESFLPWSWKLKRLDAPDFQY